MSQQHPVRGPSDPQRPSRIVDAAICLMQHNGIQALNHRAVAAQAGVPLGSTTYYFKDLDALLMASVERLTESAVSQLEEWSRSVSWAEQVPQRLSELILIRLTEQRGQAVLAYELYLLGMRRPEFRRLSERWKQVLSSIVARYLDSKSAGVLVTLVDGIMIQGLVTPTPPSVDEIQAAIEAILS